MATLGAGPLQDFVQTLGVDLQTALQRSTTRAEQLAVLTERLRGLPEDRQLFIVTRLTDSTFAQSFVQYLRQFEGTIDQALERFRSRGLILPATTVGVLSNLGLEIQDLGTIVRNDLINLLTGNTEAIQGLMQGIERALPDVVARLHGAVRLLGNNIDSILKFLPATLLQI